MKKILIGLVASLALLTGCATSDYKLYADTQVRIAEANATAQVAKFQALSKIAESGDSAAKVAAVISINMQGSNQQSTQQVAAPRSFGDSALAWASILMPNITQMYGVNRQTVLGVAQSQNAADMQIATVNGFVNIAGKIQAPVANLSNQTTNNTSLIRDSGNTNNTSTSTIVRDSGNSSVVRDSNNTTNTPTTTTTTDNRVTTTNTNSNNRTDNTSTPTVVTQPEPVVVINTVPAS